MSTTKWGSGGDRTYLDCAKTVKHLKATGKLPDGSEYPTVRVGDRIMPDFTKRVLRGMDLLDSVLPGWHTELDYTSLDLESDQQCVLGQAWPLYARAHGVIDEVAGNDNTEFQRFCASVLPVGEDENPVVRSIDFGFALSVTDFDLINTYACEDALGINAKSYDVGAHTYVPMFWEALTKTWLTQIAEARANGRWEKVDDAPVDAKSPAPA